MLLRSSVLLIGVVCLLLLVEGTACSSNDDDDYSSLSCSIQPPGEAQGHLAGCGGVAEDEVEEESAVSAKKYYLVNQCSGRFGNQMEYLAGEWAIARHLGRILVLPPFNDYGSGNSKRFPFERVFDVDSTRASIRLAQQHHCEQQRQQQLDDTCDDGAGDIVSAEEFFLDPNVIAWFEDDERESKVVEDDVTAFDPYGNNNENNNRNSDDLQTSDDADADTAGSVRVGKRLYAFVRSDTAKPNSYFATWDTYFNITSWKEMTSKSKVGSLRSKAPLRIDPSFDDEDTVLAIDCPVSSYPPSPTETSAFYGHLSFTNQIHTIVDKFLARKLTAIRQAATDATDDASSSPVKYVGIQLRRDSDMQKVCKKYSYEREWWGSHYCGHPTTMGMCWPSVDYILSKVEEVMNKHGAVAAFLATDGDRAYPDQVARITQTLSNVFRFDEEAQRLATEDGLFDITCDKNLLPRIDLEILRRSDAFLGTCTSSFTNIVVKMRRERSILSGGETPNYHFGLDVDGNVEVDPREGEGEESDETVAAR